MAKTDGSQSVPSALLDKYRATLGEENPDNVVQKRYPYRVPTMQNASSAQAPVRTAFKKCINCFNKSPQTGGATPPDIGFRSREWWYAAAGGSGLWYFDYFVQQSWATFFGDDTPDWCKAEGIADSFTYALYPDTKYGGANQVSVRNRGGNEVQYGYMKTNLNNPSYVHVLVRYSFGTTGPISVYVGGEWEEVTLTWNNQPPLGSFITSFSIPEGFTSWISIPVNGNKNIVFLAQQIGSGDSRRDWWSREEGVAERRPFWT